MSPIHFDTGFRDTEFAIGMHDEKIYVGFSGTERDSWDDVFANADVGKVDFDAGAGRVHTGVYEKLFTSTSVYGKIERILRFVDRQYRSANAPPREIVVVGYSLGGALATMYGAHLGIMYPDRRVSVHANGAYRVGDEDFKNYLRENVPNLAIFRLVFEEDAVARYPPRAWNYRHVGHLLLTDGTGKTTAYFQQTGDEDLLYAGVPGSEWDVNYIDITDITDPIDDHDSEEYLNALIAASANEAELWPTTFQRLQERYCCLQIVICLRFCYRDIP